MLSWLSARTSSKRSHATSSGQIPYDVLLLVFEALKASTSLKQANASLAAASLVSRTWYDAAHQNLYSQPVLVDHERATNFCNALHQRPELRSALLELHLVPRFADSRGTFKVWLNMLDAVQSIATCTRLQNMSAPAYFAYEAPWPAPFNQEATDLSLLYPVANFTSLRTLTLFYVRPVLPRAQMKRPRSSFSDLPGTLQELALYNFDLSFMGTFSGNVGLPSLRALAVCMCSLSVEALRNILRVTGTSFQRLIIVYDRGFSAVQSLSRPSLAELFEPKQYVIREHGEPAHPRSGLPPLAVKLSTSLRAANASIARAGLVSKAWYDAAQQCLYSRPVLVDYQHATHFCRVLSQRQSLRDALVEVHLVPHLDNEGTFKLWLDLLDAMQTLAACENLQSMSAPSYLAYDPLLALDDRGELLHLGRLVAGQHPVTELGLLHPVDKLKSLHTLSLFYLRPALPRAQMKRSRNLFSNIPANLEELALYHFDLCFTGTVVGDIQPLGLHTLALCICRLSVDGVRNILRVTGQPLKRFIIVYDRDFSGAQSLRRHDLAELFESRDYAIHEDEVAGLPPFLATSMDFFSCPHRFRHVEVTLQ
ncbi:hypothetical protein EXIGLDRAFT_759051 [Exidia glandulosa HHB12029]|uniref:F-box domain-containing protein n=1 Tax=Exidia glandulosa HHB12029 TaxID=1314781 RepID=A0A165Q6Q9_EXIGL|nr:hypothetical protein EXIGLDRAFT_759051 [Exidia glandulosa HHB12029]